MSNTLDVDQGQKAIEALMQRCKVGVPKRLRWYEETHDLLAECYGALGRQQTETARLKSELERVTRERDALQTLIDDDTEKYMSFDQVQKVLDDNLRLRRIIEEAECPKLPPGSGGMCEVCDCWKSRVCE